MDLKNFGEIFLLIFLFDLRKTVGQWSAKIEYQYYTLETNYVNLSEKIETDGLVSSQSVDAIPFGSAFLLVDGNQNYDACQTPINTETVSNGIAIIHRGGDCTFSVKITRAKHFGAAGKRKKNPERSISNERFSAVIIYDPNGTGQTLLNMMHNQSDVFSVYVHRSTGARLFDLASDRQTKLRISLRTVPFDNGIQPLPTQWLGTRSATIFIAVSTSVLVGICFLWLLVYSCQRYRARASKDRLQQRLNNAAKKALSKITLLKVKESSNVAESCVICLDSIKIGDIVRRLGSFLSNIYSVRNEVFSLSLSVCNHSFHQSCVDPWLLNHRHCPLCNLDILAAYRVSISARPRRCSVVPEIHQISTVSSTVAVVQTEQTEPTQ